MKRLDVIPKPNKVEFLGGEVDPSELEITYIEDKSLADEAYVLTVVKSGHRAALRLAERQILRRADPRPARRKLPQSPY